MIINVNNNSANKEYVKGEIKYIKDVIFQVSSAAATTKGKAIQVTDVLLYNVILMVTVSQGHVYTVQIQNLVSVVK